jgi:hypothetical protein
MCIPKLAHWIWFGPQIPGWAKRNIDEFRALHADWQIRIWQELPAEFPSDLRALVNLLPWYSSRSDIFRYWLLAQYGGVYLDTDIVILRAFDPLLKHSFFLAPCHPEGHTQPHLACGLMGSERDSRPSQMILTACRERAAKAGVPRRISYGPDLLTILFDGTVPSVSILPLHYFYAIPDRETAHRFWHADPATRAEILLPFRPTFSDGEAPFALHLWGVEGSTQRKVTDG